MAPRKKIYEVTDEHGTVHKIECDFFFDNGGTLVFRDGERGASELVATFAAGRWTSCIRAPGSAGEAAR